MSQVEGIIVPVTPSVPISGAVARKQLLELVQPKSTFYFRSYLFNGEAQSSFSKSLIDNNS